MLGQRRRRWRNIYLTLAWLAKHLVTPDLCNTVVLMLSRRRRRWFSIKATLDYHLVFAGHLPVLSVNWGPYFESCHNYSCDLVPLRVIILTIIKAPDCSILRPRRDMLRPWGDIWVLRTHNSTAGYRGEEGGGGYRHDTSNPFRNKKRFKHCDSNSNFSKSKVYTCSQC